MSTALHAVRIGVSALALAAGVAAQGAAPLITNITMVGGAPQFGVQSDLGITNQIQYSTNLSQTNWVVLTNLLVAESPYWFVDAGAPPAAQRFYRVAALVASIPPPSGMAPILGGVGGSGSFTMGDTLDDGWPNYDNIPPINVTESGFFMDTNLVSYSQWQSVYSWATNHGYSFDPGDGVGKAANHPVQTVNWYDVVKWSNARSQQGGLTPVYYTDAGFTQVYTNGETDAVYPKWAANGYRLPTEAEWEAAARGGLSGMRYPWGDTISESQANYLGDIEDDYLWGDLGPDGYNTIGNYPTTSPGTSPVGSFAPNGYHLYDMAGNLDEWCWDWYGTPYGQPTTTNPTGPASGDSRVLRGGHWYFDASYARCANRDWTNPSQAGDLYGFRCVKGH